MVRTIAVQLITGTVQNPSPDKRNISKLGAKIL
jgi:hypothetical protein